MAVTVAIISSMGWLHFHLSGLCHSLWPRRRVILLHLLCGSRRHCAERPPRCPSHGARASVALSRIVTHPCMPLIILLLFSRTHGTITLTTPPPAIQGCSTEGALSIKHKLEFCTILQVQNTNQLPAAIAMWHKGIDQPPRCYWLQGDKPLGLALDVLVQLHKHT